MINDHSRFSKLFQVPQPHITWRREDGKSIFRDTEKSHAGVSLYQGEYLDIQVLVPGRVHGFTGISILVLWRSTWIYRYKYHVEYLDFQEYQEVYLDIQVLVTEAGSTCIYRYQYQGEYLELVIEGVYVYALFRTYLENRWKHIYVLFRTYLENRWEPIYVLFRTYLENRWEPIYVLFKTYLENRWEHIYVLFRTYLENRWEHIYVLFRTYLENRWEPIYVQRATRFHQV